jgi:hypothetical protein
MVRFLVQVYNYFINSADPLNDLKQNKIQEEKRNNKNKHRNNAVTANRTIQLGIHINNTDVE